MTPTPLEGKAERLDALDYHLERVPAGSVFGVALWMLDDTLGEPSAGAWADETDLYGVVLPIAEALWWLRLKHHETWLLRGGR
jgi:hypothetical protein